MPSPPAFKYEATRYRESINGLQGLRNTSTYRPSKADQMPNIPAKDFQGERVTKFNIGPKVKPGVVRFNAKTIANGEFKADTDALYQGYKTGTVDDRLPLAFDPVGRAMTRQDVAGGSYNRDDGYVADNESHPETRVPNLEPQWQGPRSIVTPKDPNPFPIQTSEKIRLR